MSEYKFSEDQEKEIAAIFAKYPVKASAMLPLWTFCTYFLIRQGVEPKPMNIKMMFPGILKKSAIKFSLNWSQKKA